MVPHADVDKAPSLVISRQGGRRAWCLPAGGFLMSVTQTQPFCMDNGMHGQAAALLRFLAGALCGMTAGVARKSSGAWSFSHTWHDKSSRSYPTLQARTVKAHGYRRALQWPTNTSNMIQAFLFYPGPSCLANLRDSFYQHGF